jgi:hypothetical protein
MGKYLTQLFEYLNTNQTPSLRCAAVAMTAFNKSNMQTLYTLIYDLSALELSVLIIATIWLWLVAALALGRLTSNIFQYKNQK